MTQAVGSGVPVALMWLNGRPVVTLRDLPARHGHEPFWEDTLRQASAQAVLVPLDRAPDPAVGWCPAGSIFHMQRCGSTLASHLLGALPGVVSLAEPLIFQTLLMGPGTFDERVVWLRRLMALHATSLCQGGEALVVKWSSASLIFEPEISAAFPGVPAVFANRDAVEVLVSCLEGVPGHARRAQPNFFAPHLRPDGFEEIRSWPLAELLARYHGSCCYHAARADSMRLLDYAALPAVVWERLAGHFGLRMPPQAVLDAVRDRARLDVKDRQQDRVFRPDGQRKQAAASAEVRDLAERFVVPELQALRARHAAL